jgi:hypothetical protein
VKNRCVKIEVLAYDDHKLHAYEAPCFITLFKKKSGYTTTQFCQLNTKELEECLKGEITE